MVCKPIYQINFKLDGMYDAIVWVFMTVRQASVFDANNFCHHIPQLTQLMSRNIPHPERFNQMIHIEPGEESMQHIISKFQEESMQKIVSGIHDPHDILQNLSEQDICFDSKDLICRERKAVDLYDQRDSKGQMSFISFKAGSPKDH